MKKRLLKIFVNLLILLFLNGGYSIAQSNWDIPEAKAKIKNPLPADAENIKEGKSLFIVNCKSCHGEPGKDNGLPLVPKPTDIANLNFLKENSDGEIFTKITEGRVTMPTFKATLSETQRWQIVSYIRSLDESQAAIIDFSENQTLSTAEVMAPFRINLNYKPEDNQLFAFVEGTTKDGSFAPAAGMEVGLFIKRYFGKLPIGEGGQTTNVNGWVKAEVPADLPGGNEGKAVAYAQLTDYPDVNAETEVRVKVVHNKNLLDDRSLWTVRIMAPWWLIITYFGILITVWGTLAYVVLQLVKIKKEGV